MTKKEIKKFLDTHRDIELSAARLEYSLFLHKDFEEKSLELMGSFSPKIKNEREESVQMINGITDPEQIVKLMRKGLPMHAQVDLIKKALEMESEVLPLIKRRTLTNVQECFTECVLKFLLRTEENCCEWIIENYCDIRSEYMKSMLCLVLGFRGDESMIEFLIGEAKRLEHEYPDKSYDQAPLFAVQELYYRFLK